ILEQEESFNIRLRESNKYEATTYTSKDNPRDLKVYCKYHKSRYHRTEDCISLKNKKGEETSLEKTSYKKSYKNNYIAESTDEEEIRIRIKSSHGEFDALIDTGARLNYIAKETLNSMRGINITPLKEQRKIITANNTHEDIKELIHLQFTIEGIPDIEFKEEFLILNQMPIPANLGYDFLRRNNCILNIKRSTLKINDFKLDYSNYKEKNDEKEIKDLIHSRNIIIKENNEIATLINRYKNINPKTGLIPFFQ
ncbi:hypothetical protein H311_04678, partial [Anncaliia algerae PRA109]